MLVLREGMGEKPFSYINIFPGAKAKKISIKMTRGFLLIAVFALRRSFPLPVAYDKREEIHFK